MRNAFPPLSHVHTFPMPSELLDVEVMAAELAEELARRGEHRAEMMRAVWRRCAYNNTPEPRVAEAFSQLRIAWTAETGRAPIWRDGTVTFC